MIFQLKPQKKTQELLHLIHTMKGKKTPFIVTQLNVGVFTYQTKKIERNTSTANSKSRCKDDAENLIEKDSWSLLFEEFVLDYDDKLDKLIPEGHTPHCLHSDGFCKPTLKHPNTIVWFPEKKLCPCLYWTND